MPELAANFPREWLEFHDPADADRIFKCDITWLTSSWNCIYGSGCQGIDGGKPDAGCCSDGAYYSEAADEQRVKNAALRLTPQIWQFHHLAWRKGKLSISEVGLDKDRKTRKVQDSCIFLNRKGFAGGMGCALHILAVKEGRDFFETKPDVCWQLPIRRHFETKVMGDHEMAVTVIGEYERMAWGEGGSDFDWYCTSNTEAHTASEPLYKSHRKELIHLMGTPAYQTLEAHCNKKMELIAKTKKKHLPLIYMHPATLAAKS